MSLEAAAAVVLHPHPEMAGDSSHPLVTAVAARLRARGVEVATPDLRDPDIANAASALRTIAESFTAARRLLIGYSWGSLVVAQVAPAGLVARVLVAPPASSNLGTASSVPTLVLVPENDQFGGPEAAKAAFGSDADTTIEVIPGADHFLWGSIDAIADRVVEWLDALG